MRDDIITLRRGPAITDEAERKAKACLKELSGHLARSFRKYGEEATLVALRSAYFSACAQFLSAEQAKEQLRQMIEHIDVAQVLNNGGGRA